VKKNLYLFLAALLLGLGAWYTWQKNTRKSTLEKLDLNFSVPDTAAITRIVVEQFPGKGPATLERKSGGFWMINGKYNVAPVLMDVILATIRNVEMQRPLNPAERKTVLESMKARYRKVDIFVSGERYKTYFIGDDAPGNKGTYFRLENGEPYVCYLRGFNGFLTPRYNVNETDWRDRLLLSSTPQSLRSLTVSYPRSPVDNFRISLSGKFFHIENAGRFDTVAAADLILRTKGVYLERYITGFSPRTLDSLRAIEPEWILEVEDADREKSKTLWLYRTSDEDRSLAYLPLSREWITIQNRNIYAFRKTRRELVRAALP
jgi:hypothetical protein